MSNFVNCTEEYIKFIQRVPEIAVIKPGKRFLGITILPDLKEYKFRNEEYCATNKTINLDRVLYIEKIKANLYKYRDIGASQNDNGDFYAIRFYYGGDEDDEIWCYSNEENRNEQYSKISTNVIDNSKSIENIKQQITKILYQNSSDDVEAMRIKFENIGKVTNLLTNLIEKHDK